MPKQATHLASLNLFREPDGSVEITVADGKGAVAEMTARDQAAFNRSIDYIERLIIEAARNMAHRITGTSPAEPVGYVIYDGHPGDLRVCGKDDPGAVAVFAQ